jgi:hypothetical protein
MYGSEHTHTLSHTKTQTYVLGMYSLISSTYGCVSLGVFVSVFLSLSLSLSGADRTTFSPKMTKNVFRNSCPEKGEYSCSSPGLVHFFNVNVS